MLEVNCDDISHVMKSAERTQSSDDYTPGMMRRGPGGEVEEKKGGIGKGWGGIDGP